MSIGFSTKKRKIIANPDAITSVKQMDLSCFSDSTRIKIESIEDNPEVLKTLLKDVIFINEVMTHKEKIKSIFDLWVKNQVIYSFLIRNPQIAIELDTLKNKYKIKV